MNDLHRSREWIEAGFAALPEMIALRRAIHAEPELGLMTPRTTEKAKRALAGLPLEIFEGPSTTGFIALLRGPANGRTVLLRQAAFVDQQRLAEAGDQKLILIGRAHLAGVRQTKSVHLTAHEKLLRSWDAMSATLLCKPCAKRKGALGNKLRNLHNLLPGKHLLLGY